MNPVPFLAEIDLGDAIGKIIGFVIFFLAFVGGPILKALRESAEKRREAAGRGAGPTERKQAEDEARRAWDALMRGEESDAPEAQPTRSAEPPPIPISRARPTSAPPLATLGETRAEDEVETTFDEARSERDFDEEREARDEEREAREAREGELATERARRQRFLELEQGGVPTRESVGTGELSTLTTELSQQASPVYEARARIPLFGVDAGRASALRAAILAREVLGPPRALRELERDRVA